MAFEHDAKVACVWEVAPFGDFRHREFPFTEAFTCAGEAYPQEFIIHATPRYGLEAHLQRTARDVEPISERLDVQVGKCVQADQGQRLLDQRVA